MYRDLFFHLLRAARRKPFTRQGVVSVTNSLYDPLGLAAPFIIKGKHLLRSLSKEFSASHPDAWDYPLPAVREAEYGKNGVILYEL